MPRVCVVGVGLIGGSLGMALRRRPGRAYHVTGLGRDAARLRQAVRRGAVDDAFADPRAALQDADIVVFCVPVQSIVPMARRLLPFIKRGAVLTDVGSVKGSVQAGMKKLLARRRDLAFVGAHPMAGSERAGVENARHDLFKGATCAIERSAPARALSVVRRLWRDAGATCVEIDARRHDDLLALTSHLPHLLSFSLFSQAASAARKDRRVRSFVAGSFRDMTRVAGSNPDIWSGILEMNRDAIARALKEFFSNLLRLSGKRAGALRRELARIARDKISWSA